MIRFKYGDEYFLGAVFCEESYVVGVFFSLATTCCRGINEGFSDASVDAEGWFSAFSWWY